MNVIDAYVIEVLETPVAKYGYWFVKAKVTAYGVESLHNVMCKTLEEAQSVKVGDTVQI